MEITAEQAGLALILVGILLLTGNVLRTLVPALQRIFLPIPSSVERSPSNPW